MSDPAGNRARVRLVADGIHLAEPAGARVVVWEGDRIVWVGHDPDDAPAAELTLMLPGAWVTPGFVDAHVHGTATGLLLDGLNLEGTTSADDVLARLRAFAAARSDDPIVGSGWQEHGWPVPVPPSAAEIAAAAPGRRVLLNRVDGHSCLTDPRTAAEVAAVHDAGVDRDDEHRPTGWLRERAADDARTRIWRLLTPARLDAARRATVAHAAGLGITSIHEMGHPGLSSLDDAIAWSGGGWGIDVQVWWADIDAGVALDHGLRPGGDLFLDGAIGSRTAAVSGGYRDGPDFGELFHDDAAVAEFFVRCTHAGVGGGVHAIGDRAIEQALEALEAAARQTSVAAVRACRHRIEHVELARPDHPARMARLGVVASVQPVFDALWGGSDGMYASRFGRRVALESNPFDAFVAAGCTLAFGSDSTVTPMAPWDGVVAAIAHRGAHGVAPETALRAATAGGRYAAHQDDVGLVRAGQRADLAVWDGDPLTARQPRPCHVVVIAGVVTKSSSDGTLSEMTFG